MKKIFILSIFVLFIVCGCGKFEISDAKTEFKNKVNSSKGYELKGVMEIYNNDDTFKYKITVNYKKDDYYKVSMINQNNNHEQIILKNEESVYVVTPSLNKSFKFESSWPDNSSQSYILKSLVNDLVNDENATLTEEGKNYIVTTSVNYPHNKSLVNQKLYFNKDMDLEKVIVFDENKSEKIKLTINSIDYKAKYKDDYFDLDTLIDDSTKDEENSQNQKKETTSTNTTADVDDISYPLYVPSNTYLKSKDKVDNEGSSRTILTFNGDKSFVLVEEAADVSKEFEILPVSGDPLILTNTVAALSDKSITWTANNKEYYITSNNLTANELATIADSMGSTTVGK